MILELNNVKKKYDLFELDCTFKVEEGCVTGLIGKNGAGKSTAFKTILGLIKIDSGSVTVDGKMPDKLSKEEKENIGVVLSDSGFSGYLTVSDAIAVMKSKYSKFSKEAFIERCKHFDIPLNKKIKDFSTGMRAKLKVLLAMSHSAKLLILDEPTAGLDVVARDEILEMLRDYMQSGENSILISSHISDDLEGICDDIYMINDGRIILHEDTDVILDEYAVLKVTDEQYEAIDKDYILKTKKERFGYVCLTNQKRFYMENYPEIIIEKSGIDEVIMLMINGREV